MTACGTLESLQALGTEYQNIFLVRDVAYDAEPSLEIQRVREFELDEVPDDLKTRSWRHLMSAVQARLKEQG